jgi:hypothetical protein
MTVNVKSALEVSDDEAAAVQKTPNRVTLESMMERVMHAQYINPTHCPHMTIAVVTLDNGYTIIGQSAPADPANFDVTLGIKFSTEDAIGKIWPLEGYLLAEKLYVAKSGETFDTA